MPTELVQVRNPKSDRYVKIDRVAGKIVSHKQSAGPYKGIPIVSNQQAATFRAVGEWLLTRDNNGPWLHIPIQDIEAFLNGKMPEALTTEGRSSRMTKPTHPGFYWYRNQYADWEIVRLLKDKRGNLRAWYFANNTPDSIDTLTGEWGPEIVHD